MLFLLAWFSFAICLTATSSNTFGLFFRIW